MFAAVAGYPDSNKLSLTDQSSYRFFRGDRSSTCGAVFILTCPNGYADPAEYMVIITASWLFNLNDTMHIM